MATYKANSTFTYIITGNSYSERYGLATYGVTRAFVRFDTSTVTPPLADITAVDLIMNCTTASGGGDTVLVRSANSGDTNWGTTITNTVGDFASTNAHAEGTANCTSTGTKTFSINKNNLDLSGVTWFRFQLYTKEYGTNTSAVWFSSANHGTASLRPKLRITYSSGVTQILRALTGVGT
jgi:hypothetical protein